MNENILLDLPIGGVTRKVLVRPERNGFMYVMDRATGEVLSADPYGPLNWATRIDLRTGRPVLAPEKATGHRRARVFRKRYCRRRPSGSGRGQRRRLRRQAGQPHPAAFADRPALLDVPAVAAGDRAGGRLGPRPDA